MNFVLVSTDEYPDQHAAAIRHSTIAQGIVENGHKVYFFVLSPQNWKATEINYKGVKFQSLDSHHEDNKLLKLYNFYNALEKLKIKIFELQEKTGIDGIILFSINNKIIKQVLKIGRKKNIKVFHERTELPYVFGVKDSVIKYLRYRYYLTSLIPQLDGLFVISDKLRAFFLPYNKNIKKILTVVDTDFFTSSSDPVYDFTYIGYCGTMSGTKDGIPVLIEAFAKLRDDFPEYKLLLVGNNDENKIKDTLTLIDRLNLGDNIVFSGFVDREAMPRILGNARLLVVSKPDNEQNSGNFPIKIGEYLSTGVPVVVTAVGEIPNFIVDGQTGFLAMPGSVESFYLKMKEALSDYERAKRIGLAGRELAKKEFDYKMQAGEVVSFILKTQKSDGS